MNNIDKLIENQKIYAKENKVPIILDEGLSLLIRTIKENNIKTVLEIGTAIAYSAINMASAGASVVTIERDTKMIEIARENIKLSNLPITLVEGDAKEVFSQISQYRFDMIFIDAAKGSYKTFFDLYTPLLNDNGIVVCDNMDFHGLTDESTNLEGYSRGLRSMIRKLNGFKTSLLADEGYDTIYYHVGDGVTISKKRG